MSFPLHGVRGDHVGDSAARPHDLEKLRHVHSVEEAKTAAVVRSSHHVSKLDEWTLYDRSRNDRDARRQPNVRHVTPRLRSRSRRGLVTHRCRRAVTPEEMLRPPPFLSVVPK